MVPPLPASMAPEVTDVGDADAELMDAPGPSVGRARIEQREQPLCSPQTSLGVFLRDNDGRRIAASSTTLPMACKDSGR